MKHKRLSMLAHYHHIPPKGMVIMNGHQRHVMPIANLGTPQRYSSYIPKL